MKIKKSISKKSFNFFIMLFKICISNQNDRFLADPLEVVFCNITSHVLFPVDDLKGSIYHTDHRLICTDHKKIQENCTEQSKICTIFSFVNSPVEMGIQ